MQFFSQNYEKEDRKINRCEVNGSKHYPNFICSQFCHATLCLNAETNPPPEVYW